MIFGFTNINITYPQFVLIAKILLFDRIEVE